MTLMSDDFMREMEFERKEQQEYMSREMFQTNLYPYVEIETGEQFYSLNNYTFEEMEVLKIEGGITPDAQVAIIWCEELDRHINNALKMLPGSLDSKILMTIHVLSGVVRMGDGNLNTLESESETINNGVSMSYAETLLEAVKMIETDDRREAITRLQTILAHHFKDESISYVLKYKEVLGDKDQMKYYDSLIESEIFRGFYPE